MSSGLQRCIRSAVGPLVLAVLAGCSDAPAPGAESPDADEAAITASMITAIKTITQSRKTAGIVPRLNQSKSLGCFNGEFTVEEDLADHLSHGLFSEPDSYEAQVRFANASTRDDREKDFRGMSVKLSGIEGEALWGEDGQQDFLLNSHPALFAEDPDEFLAFLEASADDAMWKFFINPLHWDSVMVLFKGREKITSPFDIAYWSTTPYRFGPDRKLAVKYSARPCSATNSDMPDRPHEDYLRDNMRDHLQQSEACFDFMVQFQGDPQQMPIEDASVVWDETKAPFVKVATLTIKNQEFTDVASMRACDQMRFNPWQSLPEHRPIGGINRVRRAVYAEAGDFRLQHSHYGNAKDGKNGE